MFARYIPIAALILWGASLALPGIIFVPGAESDILKGYSILFFGWLGVFFAIFAWLGNPFLILSCYLALKKRFVSAFYTSFFAFAFGISAFAVFGFPMNDGMHIFVIDHLEVGYYVWLSAILLMWLYSYFQSKKENGGSAPFAKVTLIISLAIAVLISIASFSVSNFFQNEELRREESYESRKKIEAENRSDNNLMNPFRRVFQDGNYRVIIEESRLSSYFEKGKLVRVGAPTENDPSKNYMIIKNNKVYVINAAKKSFTESDVTSELGKAAIAKMSTASIIDGLLESENGYGPPWKRDKNSQKKEVKNSSVEITFDPETNLLTSMYVTQSDNKVSVMKHFQYEKISDEAMLAEKMFPLEYKKVDP